ncbi:MAG TPA: M50 family metallopeptidase [Gaiellaceae bacterium]|nr:M50 family metallopeptidase [Gaiellaceae bacterium]
MSGFGVFIFIFAVLLAIGIHEAGHFATAKWFKIKVDRFFIGFGPKLWSMKRGETEYGVSAFPIGGYVRIAGMNPLEEIPPEERSRTFKAKPAWQRAIVLAAGSVTHFLVALIIIAAILATAGEPDFDNPTLTIGAVGPCAGEDEAPSELAGLKAGDRVVSVAGESVTEWRQVQEAIRNRSPGQTIDIVVERDGRQRSFNATLGGCERDGRTIAFLGVSPEFATVERPVGSAIVTATARVGTGMWDSLVAFKNIFSPSTLGRLFKVAVGQEERRPEDPATVVGIGKTSGDLARQGDFVGLFLLVAGFNVFVGVANLLPLPPLDGGHLAVLGFEKLTRREVDMRKLIPITAMVLTVFGMLFLLLLYTDIVNPLPAIPG